MDEIVQAWNMGGPMAARDVIARHPHFAPFAAYFTMGRWNGMLKPIIEFRFPNGFGASILSSWGSEEDLELAVLDRASGTIREGTMFAWGITYDTCRINGVLRGTAERCTAHMITIMGARRPATEETP